ncbi:hypothetical protein [Streptomyces sp. V1I1]|uniref:hypothetical protein n=1 Tax=Streptomyces sp. V1I1 TaxID=3042272 RepID=UPI0027D82651|nr:hypothetical protein [Streptomyces sp. V1I1]
MAVVLACVQRARWGGRAPAPLVGELHVDPLGDPHGQVLYASLVRWGRAVIADADLHIERLPDVRAYGGADRGDIGFTGHGGGLDVYVGALARVLHVDQ